MAAIGIVYAVKSTGPSTEPSGAPRVNRVNRVRYSFSNTDSLCSFVR